MQALILQHAPFEDLGSIEPWLASQNITFHYSRLFNDDPLPGLENLDLIIVLGGPMSVNDTQSFPWLQKEKSWISKAIQKQIPMLGICLGAQLIANVLGSKIIPSEHKELGWFSVHSTNASLLRKPLLPNKINAFHWHGETFSLPPKSIRLAYSEGCENQAFLFKKNVLGLQFHLECTPSWVNSVLTHCDEALNEPGLYIQSRSTIVNTSKTNYTLTCEAISHLLSTILSS